MNNSIFFIELSDQEIKSKCTQVLDREILFWVPRHLRKNETSNYEFKVTASYKEEDRCFVVSDLEYNIDDTALYLCRFMVGDVTYFSAGQWKINQNTSCFKLADKIFRYEKRQLDRLLTYPHRQVYLVVQIPNNTDHSTDSNVVTLQKHRSVLEELYKKLNPEELEGIKKFRVLDISCVGVAFLSGKHEIDIFDRDDLDVKIEFDGKRYPIKLENILYQVAYLDVYAKTNTLLKLGATLQMDTELKDKINFYLQDDSLIRFDVKHGFEDFILRQLR